MVRWSQFDAHVAAHAAVKTLTVAVAELARGTVGADVALAEALAGVARDASTDPGHELATRTDIAAPRVDMAALEVRLLKSMIGTAVTVAGVAVAVLGLLE